MCVLSVFSWVLGIIRQKYIKQDTVLGGKNAQSGPNIDVTYRKVCRGDQQYNLGCRFGFVALVFWLARKCATSDVYVFLPVVFIFSHQWCLCFARLQDYKTATVM